jgi:glycerol-3-phosphate dehydrogenase
MSKTTFFSVLDRPAQTKRIQETTFDLVVIGGGITGAGIALDAAARGMKICLIEKNDFASGTSNKSTKLIHGGLRYLKQLEIGLVKESGRERAIVHNLAPHLVIPEKMLLPLIKEGNYGALMTSFGLKVYDVLANVEGEDKRKMLDKAETLKKEPLLDERTLLGGGFYSEYRTDDARLTIELLKIATVYGAEAINYCEMTAYSYSEKGKVNGVIAKDHTTDACFKIASQRVVSAAGPWVDLLRKKDGILDNKHLYLTKGVHLVFPYKRLPIQQSIYFDTPDGRMIFAIPRGRVTYLGTTDTAYTGSLDRVVTTKSDVTYLLNAVNSTFKSQQLTEKDIISSWAGLRPLIHKDEKSPSELSRKDEIFVSDSGLISIAGGKLTGYRKMAQRVNEKVISTLKKEEREKWPRSKTKSIPLTQPPFANDSEVEIYQTQIATQLEQLGVSIPFYAQYLVSTYGKKTDCILERAVAQFANISEESLLLAEFWYCLHHEKINTLADFFVRRTGRLYFYIESVHTYKKTILNAFVEALHWSKERQAKELTALDLLLKDATTFYDAEF